ncbi:helix-turn-helix domain-containing protein [Acidianus brierleyi]|uniref:TrmB family transcriptional regulator n=1 Tax=Acidianus brierleyi TaxID=41673 RepID=A0A2U9IJ69_9CREN|nr:helix-turn-helix domain-containing protein [Acidianus brierleyi]AWR96016.1 TrmB family transcriptional regulator [Acidianus brierleyi]
MSERIRFPDGREVDIHEVIAFLYGLSKSDVEVLHLLMTKGKKLDTDELAGSLHVTKASISKSINNLLYKGLINRDKVVDQTKQKGRPNYVYWVNNEELYGRLIQDLNKLVDTVKKDLQSHVQTIPA